MSRRTFYKCIVIVAYIIGVALLFGGGNGTFTKKLSEGFVQHEASSHLPKTFHGITAREATITLNDQIEILAELDGSKLGRHFTMVIHAIGQPDYEHSKNGELYFKSQQVTVVDFSYTGKEPGKLLGAIRDRYVTNQGVKNLLSDAIPHVETWAKEAAEKTAVVLLQHIPVYKLKNDWKGYFIGGAVTEVSVQGKELAITFSLWGVTKIVLVGVAVVLLGIGLMIALFACPELGIALASFG